MTVRLAVTGLLQPLHVQDLVVVETGDVILVCHRDAVQDIKKLMRDLPAAVR